MPKYLLEVNYTLDGVKGVMGPGWLRSPGRRSGCGEERRREAWIRSISPSVAPMCSPWPICPHNAAAAALALAVTAGGGAAVKTVVLLTPAEIDAATKAKVLYTPPGS